MKKINYFLVFLFVIIASLKANASSTLLLMLMMRLELQCIWARPSWHCRMETMRSM